MNTCKNARSSIVFITVMFFVLALCMPCFSIAGYASVSGEVKTIVSQTHAYSEPDINSQIINDLNIGDYAFVTGEEGDFYVIYYMDQTGYVLKYAIDGTDAPSYVTDVTVNPDAAELASSARKEIEEMNNAVDNELKAQEVYNDEFELFLNQKEKSRRNKIIWIAAIATLCVCMIVISVVVALKYKNDEDAQEDVDNKEGT